MKKTLAISIGTIMAGGLNIILNLTMIPVFGYEIAAWTTVISYFCLFIFHWFNVSVLLKEKTIGIGGMMVLAIIAPVVTLILYSVSDLHSTFSIVERVVRFGVCGLVSSLLIIYVLRIAKRDFGNRLMDGE